MAECPICRRTYDGRFQVFVPSHPEGFDTVECARRAAEAAGWAAAAPAAVVLPSIEVADPRAAAQVASVPHRGKIATLGALVVAPGQAVLAAGVGLLAAGAAAGIYLSVHSSGTAATPVAVGAAHPPQTVGPPAAAIPPSPAPPVTRPPAGRAAP